MITCRDCAEALNPFLDRELSDEDLAQVHVHLEACGGCQHLFKFQASLRRLVRVRCLEQQAPDILRVRIEESFALERMRASERRIPPQKPGA